MWPGARAAYINYYKIYIGTQTNRVIIYFSTLPFRSQHLAVVQFSPTPDHDARQPHTRDDAESVSCLVCPVVACAQCCVYIVCQQASGNASGECERIEEPNGCAETRR